MPERCPPCRHRHRLDYFKAWIETWPQEEKRDHWRNQKRKRRARVGCGGEYQQHKRRFLLKMMGAEREIVCRDCPTVIRRPANAQRYCPLCSANREVERQRAHSRRQRLA
jgi:hypothetical protein